MLEQSITKSQHEHTDKRFAVRRVLAGLALLATLAGANAVLHDPVGRVVGRAINDVETPQEYLEFGIPVADIQKKMADGEIDPSSVTLIKVKNTEANLTDVANDVHAISPVDMAVMFTGQLGTDRNTHAGQVLVLPNDMVERPLPK